VPAQQPTSERILLITGRLAEGLARQVAQRLSSQFSIEIKVVGISVAALMHVEWLRRKLTIDGKYDRVVVPGWCQGELDELTSHYQIPFERGPKELLDLPEYLTGKQREPVELNAYDIEILAEINHAPRLSLAEILAQSKQYRKSGADLIDLGCIPGETWQEIAHAVAMLRDEGFRISVDSFDQQEVAQAVTAGAELVLSCNQSNVGWLKELPVESVVIPDQTNDLASFHETIEELSEANRTYRLDPILEPIGFQFAASLGRYYEVRRRYPDTPMMMGIGNLTEMTEVDSAGANVLLAAICQELTIHSVLTTEVINWARSSVQEFDLARKLVKHAIDHKTLPKHVDSQLVMLRDRKVTELGDEGLRQLAAQLKDPNYRIFVERGEIHVMNRDGYWHGSEPFELFDQFSQDAKLDASHAFYLGYELSKAMTALALRKQYRQDQALQWGFLTIPEVSAHERRRQPKSENQS